MMAVVMLVGIVVNNAILMIDGAQTHMGQGQPPREAIWLGTRDRFKAINMTSIAIVVGAIPQVFDPSTVKASMGGVIVGGVVGSIVFTYWLIPVTFLAVERVRRFFS